MTKTILITGATDGIGLLTAQKLAARGHRILLHGRSSEKLERAAQTVGHNAETYIADLGDLAQVRSLATTIGAAHDRIDVVINNAGVLKTPQPRTAEGIDLRFIVNTVAPYLLTQGLLPRVPAGGRVVNLSSAAQAPVDLNAMRGGRALGDMEAYAQSKRAITLWTLAMAQKHPAGPVFVSVNPGSLLASKMVKEGFGVAGSDLSIGADILCSASLDDVFAHVSGQYFDNDSGAFSALPPAALDPDGLHALITAIEELGGA